MTYIHERGAKYTSAHVDIGLPFVVYRKTLRNSERNLVALNCRCYFEDSSGRMSIYQYPGITQ